VTLLLKYGADPTFCNSNGKDALWVVRFFFFFLLPFVQLATSVSSSARLT
jgi:hypothetical protein